MEAGAEHRTNVRQGRIRSLDGLRGIAALVVVIHHILLTVPSLAVAYQFAKPHYSHNWMDILIFSPLHLVWDGPTAVAVFFILSGYVLSAPYATGKAGGWLSYYPQRLLRLYLPVWAALAMALICVSVVARHSVADATYFVNIHATSPHGVAQAARNASLVFKTGWLDSPLWSLRFEVAFSVILPAALVAGRLWWRLWPLKIALSIVVVIVGWLVNSQFLEYVPMFGLGVILAYEQDRFAHVTSRLARTQWTAIAAGSLLLMTSYWDMWGIGLGRIAAIGQGLSAIGACGILLVMRDCSSARRVGETGVVQWLGKRSFSLYLVHEPILLTLIFALGGKPNVALTFALAMPIVLLAAEGFFRIAERPSHLFAQAVGRKVKAYMTPAATPTTQHGQLHHRRAHRHSGGHDRADRPEAPQGAVHLRRRWIDSRARGAHHQARRPPGIQGALFSRVRSR